MRETPQPLSQQPTQPLDQSFHPTDLISKGVRPTMAKGCKLFKENEYIVPELLISVCATKEILRQTVCSLRP